MNTYFISDLHLGAGYIKDARAHEQRIVNFLRSIEDKADRLYMLGDILDYWFEYRTVVPRGYIRFFGQLARMADKGVKIYWFIGNHDIWLFDYLRNEIGLTVIDGTAVHEIGGKKFMMSHGDGLGELKTSFKLIRNIFRNRVCQILYAGIHPRWTVGFAHWWSSKSRGEVVQTAFEGELKANIMNFATDYASKHPDIDYILLGHHHVVADVAVSSKCQLMILGDWISHFTYAVFDGKNLRICYDLPLNN